MIVVRRVDEHLSVFEVLRLRDLSDFDHLATVTDLALVTLR